MSNEFTLHVIHEIPHKPHVWFACSLCPHEQHTINEVIYNI